MLLFASVLVTDRRREAAVGELKAKGRTVLEHVGVQGASAGPASVAGASGRRKARQEKTGASSTEDSVAACARMIARKKALWDNPSWQEAIKIFSEKKPREWTEADRQKVAEFVAANREMILELRRLAKSGGLAYELDYSKGFAMELPHLAQLRDFARLLMADAALKAGEGDFGEAVEDITAGMAFASALDKEPILISQLVRMAMDGIIYNAVEGSVQGGHLTPELSRRLIEYASRAGGREAYADSFTFEGFFGLGAFDAVRNGDLAQTGIGLPEEDRLNSVLLRVYGSVFARPWLNMDEETYADSMQRMNEAARRPFYEAKPLFDQIETEIGDLPRTRLLSRILLPALARSAEMQAAHEARMDLMQLGLAVEQYYVENGQYPTTLDQVAPLSGGAIPIDPFTGQPYVYQPSGGRFLIYSATASLVDAERARHFPGADEQGNIVWRGSH
jgi:hypothetical protein